ncbi:MAG: hypothetical protein LBP59_06445 [Planctomycetaceae bacterium]|nr:hypothetical protein [Planctomycetaceae bacterium]
MLQKMPDRRRDARDPLVSPAFQDRSRDGYVPSQFFITKKNCPTCPSCSTCP